MTVGKGGSWCFSVLTVLIALLNIIVTLATSGANGNTVHKPNFRIPQESPSGWKLPCVASRSGMELVVTQKSVSTVWLVITV